MKESKYQVLNWKRWKATAILLKETKKELENTTQAISYSNELPGGSHKTIYEKYNKLIENLDKYDEHIKMYDTVIDFLEESITKLLNEKQREVIIIYSNYPNNSIERINEAVKKGYSQATFYRIADEAFDILDEVLALKNRDVEKILKAEKENRLLFDYILKEKCVIIVMWYK